MATYQIEILDSSLTKVTEVKTPFPLNAQGDILRFSKELSDFGTCTFRISAYDSIFNDFGDIIFPHQYHVRIRRNGFIAWQGAIIENTKRNKQFVEVVAVEYEWYLEKLLVKRSSNNPVTGKADGVFRIFSSGTMATAVTNIINETIARVNVSTNKASPLHGMTLGTVENPDFPPNMTDATGKALKGGWTFSSTLELQFDFHTVLYVLKAFGIYTYADFYFDENLVFNFKKFVGNDRHFDVNFKFSQQNSNIVDYNLPRLGQRMVNSLWGVATDTSGAILNKAQSDQASITRFGILEGVAAYADVKDQGILDARTRAELPLVSTPDETNAIVVLDNTSAQQLGVWDIGDIVNIEVSNNGIDFNEIRRIVGVSVAVQDTGKETTTVQSNIPLPWQYGSKTS